MIIDTHQHLWDLDRVAYPWLVPEFGPIARTFVPEDLELEAEHGAGPDPSHDHGHAVALVAIEHLAARCQDGNFLDAVLLRQFLIAFVRHDLQPPETEQQQQHQRENPVLHCRQPDLWNLIFARKHELLQTWWPMQASFACMGKWEERGRTS